MNAYAERERSKIFILGRIHKGCPHLGGGRGIVTMRTKRGQGEIGGLAVSGHPFQCGLCKREEGI